MGILKGEGEYWLSKHVIATKQSLMGHPWGMSGPLTIRENLGDKLYSEKLMDDNAFEKKLKSWTCKQDFHDNSLYLQNLALLGRLPLRPLSSTHLFGSDSEAGV